MKLELLKGFLIHWTVQQEQELLTLENALTTNTTKIYLNKTAWWWLVKAGTCIYKQNKLGNYFGLTLREL